MIIDDEPLVAAALAAVLRKKHQVETFTSSRDALERLGAAPPFDIVLCDLTMPELSGPELYSRLCERRPEYADRFVFITGGPTTPALKAFLGRTGTRALAKPITRETLEAAIAARLAAT